MLNEEVKSAFFKGVTTTLLIIVASLLFYFNKISDAYFINQYLKIGKHRYAMVQCFDNKYNHADFRNCYHNNVDRNIQYYKEKAQMDRAIQQHNNEVHSFEKFKSDALK